MGVILNETITLPNGLTATNPYASLGRSSLHVEKMNVSSGIGNDTDTTKYILEGRFTMWVSQALRVSGSNDIGGFSVAVESETPPTGDVYGLLYNKLKTMKTCTDAI